MSVSPSTVNFNYTQQSGVLPSQAGTITVANVFVTAVTFTKPSWLTVILSNIDATSSGSTIDIITKVNSSGADQLAEGDYNSQVTANITFQGAGGDGTMQETYNVSIDVTAPLVLAIDPQVINKNAEFGAGNPSAVPLSITTENNWSIVTDANWLSVSNANGNGSDTVQVLFNINGLSVGSYTGNILVDDGINTKTCVVNLIISTSSSQQFVIVNPDLIEVSENQGEIPQSTGQFILENTLDVDVSTPDSWISVISQQYAPGIHAIGFSIQSTASFSLGTYVGAIQFSSVIGITEVTILLKIVNEDTSGIQSNFTYFAKDYNTLNLSNAQSDAEVILKHRVETADGIKIYKRKLPYFQNQIKAEIGLETANLLKPISRNDIETNRIYRPFSPLKYKIEVFNKLIGENNLQLNNTFNDMLFLNGRSPEDVFTYLEMADVDQSTASTILKRLSYLPKVVYVQNNSYLSFSFYSSAVPNDVTISIAVTQGSFTAVQTDSISAYFLSFNPSPSNLYTVVINLNNYSLNEGNVVDIDFEISSCKAIIKKPQAESVQLMWQNQWDMLEVFNCTGTITIDDTSDSETAEYVKDNKEITEEFAFKRAKDFEVNTGDIYTREEVNQLKTILTGKNIRIKHGNNIYKVVKRFTKLESFETRKFISAFSLKFQSAEV